MSLLDQVATGAIQNLEPQVAQAIGDGAWVDSLVQKGRGLVESQVEDEAVAAGLRAALDVIATPEAKAVIGSTSQGAFTSFMQRVGMGATGEAREEYIRNAASFDERHAMLQADTEAAIQAKTNLDAVVSGIESLVVDVLAKGGAAAAPFFVALL